MNQVTIVMYHYIRDFRRTRYPRIRGLDVAGFERQLDYLQANYSVVRMEEVIAAAAGGPNLPADAALLTFDDGYSEHYEIAFPILHERGLQGSFFPPVAPVTKSRLLDVNRVHFILASVGSAHPLTAEIDRFIEATADPAVSTVADYRSQWAHPNRFDDAETIYAKRMLQTALPPEIRSDLSHRLFEKFVDVDESTMANELYLTEQQARVMTSNGMFFGSHGDSHIWLNHADDHTRTSEIDGSLNFLADVGMDVSESWVMCYPYGGYDERLIDLLTTRGCSIGLTTEVAVADLARHHALALPRLDTNDFPQ